MINDVTDWTFDRVIEQAGVPVLVEFWQPGCGGCQALMQELEKVQAEVGGQIMIVKMNVQENYQIPAELEITSLPALALYREGRFDRFIGGLGKKDRIVAQLGL